MTNRVISIRRPFLWSLAVCSSLLPGTPLTAADRKPNILLILADDLGYADVGFNGCKDIPTPHHQSQSKL